MSDGASIAAASAIDTRVPTAPTPEMRRPKRCRRSRSRARRSREQQTRPQHLAANDGRRSHRPRLQQLEMPEVVPQVDADDLRSENHGERRNAHRECAEERREALCTPGRHHRRAHDYRKDRHRDEESKQRQSGCRRAASASQFFHKNTPSGDTGRRERPAPSREPIGIGCLRDACAAAFRSDASLAASSNASSALQDPDNGRSQHGDRCGRATAETGRATVRTVGRTSAMNGHSTTAARPLVATRPSRVKKSSGPVTATPLKTR